MASSLLVPRQGPRNSSTCAGYPYGKAGLDDRIDSDKDVFILTYRAATYEEEENPGIFDALAHCCEPNEVHMMPGECVLWCELPDQYRIDRDNDTAGTIANMETDLATNCFAEMMDDPDPDLQWSGVTTREGGGSLVERPSVVGLLLLATMLVHLYT